MIDVQPKLNLETAAFETLVDRHSIDVAEQLHQTKLVAFTVPEYWKHQPGSDEWKSKHMLLVEVEDAEVKKNILEDA